MVRSVLMRSPRLRELVWPSTDTALHRRRDASLIVEAVFRTVTGREPYPAERANMLARVNHGLDFGGLIEELLRTPDAVDYAAGRIPSTLRQLIEQESAAGPEPGGDVEARVLFMHIMKTGGTSLSDLLRRWAGPSRARVGIPLDDLVVMPRPMVARLRAIAGHIPFETVATMPTSFRTVTVLRDPVSRTVSHYRELRRGRVGGPELSFDEFLRSEVYDVPSGNYQARSLAHKIGLADAWITFSPMERYLEVKGQPDQPYPLQALFDATPILISEDELLERAATNLATVDYVGVTEDLPALAARVGALFGIRDVSVPVLNASGPAETLDLPARTRRLIEQRTAVDRELYEQALRLSKE